MVKKFMLIGLLLFLIWGGVLSAGAAPEASGPLSQVIEGAKKEGVVSVKLWVGVTPKSIGRLEREIKERFGVDLKVKFTPVVSMPKDLSDAIMEQKAGTTPSYDLLTLGPEHVVTGLKAGIFEKVEWSSLLTKDVSPDVVVNLSPYGEVGLSCFTSLTGLLYNPTKVPSSEVPKSLDDLAAPKWKGKIGILNYPASWAVRAHVLGKDKVLSNIRALLKNGAIQGVYADIYNRYMLGEISLAFIGNSFFKMAQDKGMPAAWQNIDYVEEESRPLVLQKRVLNPNAAKLVSIYLCSSQGAKFMLEESGAGNACYPGNFTHDIRMQGKEQGMRIISKDKEMDFFETPDYAKWMQEIKLILETGR